MKSLIQILNESQEFNINNFIPIRDWVDSNYNSEIGYNKNVDINKLLNLLSNYKDYGLIYRAISVPNETEIESYIRSKITNRYASFCLYIDGAKYFAKNFLENSNEKIIFISQNSEYYDLDSWYQDNFEQLYDLKNEVDWITTLSEIENTTEVIAKMSNNFKIIK